MERILSVEQMRAADEYTINSLGLTSEILTERAAAAVAEEIKKRLYGGRVLVCIGKGHNGEDGKIIAGILSSIHGFTVATLNVSNGILKMLDKKFDIIVDCIFGTGLNREVEGKYRQAIEKINASGAFVISCDIASGLNGNTGRVMGAAVKADLTVAVQEYKLGHFLNDGPDYSGEIVAKDIGISIWGEDYAKRLNSDDAAKYFQPRPRNVHKGNFGKVAVLGGSKSFAGSALLSLGGVSALKLGNGYANLAVPECIYGALAGLNPECTLTVMPSDGEKLVFDEQSLNKLLNYDAIAVGMGMGVSPENYKIISYLLENYKGKLVIDADGLNTLSFYGVEVLKNKECETVLTPHIGEFSRLIKKDKCEITDNSIRLAADFAKEYGVTLVLKSAVSIITDGTEVYINVSGHSGMAKAGSGDVLSGFVAGLLARSAETLEAAATACYIYGKAGEFAVKAKNEYTVTATDFIAVLPEVINAL